MKTFRLLLLSGVLAVCASSALLTAADKPTSEPTTPYNARRSFAQPVRDDPVGRTIAANRSFWGAPPPMPHTFAGDRDGTYCLTCHARETRIEKRQQAIAPVPHAEYSQCQQCHVNGTDRSQAVFRESLFVGLDFPGKGTRAHPFAPPTIPHKTFMRDNCLSCHGPAGKQRIASPHPFRSQCQQCHVPDASKNYGSPLPWKDLHGEF
jgi:cytochrome c-type protein NapB